MMLKHRSSLGRAGSLVVCLLMTSLGVDCDWLFDLGRRPFNPFQDLPPVALDGRPLALEYNVAPLGWLEKGSVVHLRVDGTMIKSVLVLAEDPDFEQAGALAGGGQPNTFFDYRVQAAGRYFVYVLFDLAADADSRHATLTAAWGDANYHPPARQIVRVIFEQDYLTDPGLVDPESFTDDERQLLVNISGLVRDGIMDRLRTIFDGTPIDIQAEDDPLPDSPYSTLRFSPERHLPEPGEVFDVAEPPRLAQHPECRDLVVFGEILPSGRLLDPGNQTPDDEGVVYVGSFQGRGASCRSAATDSVNNIILGLAHTGAHEIGHMVGLFHVPLTDIMDRSPTLAFQRELRFNRGQLLVEGAGRTEILTTVIQDPTLYWEMAFDQPD